MPLKNLETPTTTFLFKFYSTNFLHKQSISTINLYSHFPNKAPLRNNKILILKPTSSFTYTYVTWAQVRVVVAGTRLGVRSFASQNLRSLELRDSAEKDLNYKRKYLDTALIKN